MNLFLHLFHLQGYGKYVWPAYGLVAVFLLLQWFLPWKRWRSLKQQQRGERAQSQ